MNLMKKLLVCILFVLFGTQIFAQEIDKGYEAYNDGDYALALKEWKPIAEKGYAFAQYNLGIMYEYGNGVPKDYSEAVKWYRLSAEQGYAIGQYSLGLMYSNGYGVLKDKAEAVKWLRSSAEQSYSYAQGMLGIMYELGEGVHRDNIIAYMWYNIASDNGHESAGDWRDGRASFMNSSDVKKATDMANKCLESNYKNCVN